MSFANNESLDAQRQMIDDFIAAAKEYEAKTKILIDALNFYAKELDGYEAREALRKFNDEG